MPSAEKLPVDTAAPCPDRIAGIAHLPHGRPGDGPGFTCPGVPWDYNFEQPPFLGPDGCRWS